MTGDVATTSLFTSSPRTVPQSTDTFVPDDTGIDGWLYLTDPDEANCAVAFDSNMQDLQSIATQPALDMYAYNDSESASSEDLQQISPGHSTSVQNDPMGKLSLVRMRYFYCPTCQFPCISEFRLRYVLRIYYCSSLLTVPSEHLRKYHPPVQFICNICYREFTTNKDLRRHGLIHDRSRQPFTCSCGKAFSRNDGLKRHITKKTHIPREAGYRKAAESNPR
jgi:uncharacterized Zn-finger protein